MIRLVLFLLLNFGALGLGSYLMGEGPMGLWYQELNKAPWTPPGWVFGAAWTLIMVALSIYMSKAVQVPQWSKTLIVLYALQWVLNVSWNPLFFMFHKMGASLVVMLLLIAVVAAMALVGKKELPLASWWLTPYLLWLSIAATLNGYALMHN